MLDKILVICVDYHSEAETASYVEDLFAQNNADNIDIVVVCNSGSESIEAALSGFSRIKIYDFGANLGYFPAACAGLSKYLETNYFPSFIIVSNTDIKIPNRNFFNDLVKRVGAFDVLAPRISNLSGIDQNPFLRHRIGRVKLRFLLEVFRFYPFFYLYSKLSVLKAMIKALRPIPPASESFGIYAPHGSFIVFSKSYFEKGGTLNHESFLYGEELYVAETAFARGMMVVYEPNLEVYHLEHVTTGFLGARKKASYLFSATKRMLDQFYRKDSL